MDYMKATEHLKELRGETENLAGHQAATSFLLSESFIQYLESDTEYAYILADKDRDGIENDDVEFWDNLNIESCLK
jgi:hypothetical protein